MKPLICERPPAKQNTSYCMSAETVSLVRKEAKKLKTSASRLVEAIIRERLAQEKSK